MLIGGGGREHAILRSLKKNPSVETVWMLPGNGGMADEAICTGISATDLEQIVAFAKEHGKIAAVTETGHETLKDPKWWTEVLYPSIKDYPVSYVLTWRNACDQPNHYYAPFPGQESADDFKAFSELDQILLL